MSSTRSKWLDWEPPGQSSKRIRPSSEPTKPTKPRFDGFVGSNLGDSHLKRTQPPQVGPLQCGSSDPRAAKTLNREISQDPLVPNLQNLQNQSPASCIGAPPVKNPAGPIGPNNTTPEAQAAYELLRKRGMRLMVLGSAPTVGAWPELDDRDFRAALPPLGLDHLPVRWLDSPDIPDKYRTCRSEVLRLRKARQPLSWEQWVLSQPKGAFGPQGGTG